MIQYPGVPNRFTINKVLFNTAYKPLLNSETILSPYFTILKCEVKSYSIQINVRKLILILEIQHNQFNQNRNWADKSITVEKLQLNFTNFSQSCQRTCLIRNFPTFTSFSFIGFHFMLYLHTLC